MYPSTSVYGGWPKSGDIDIIETRGKKLGLVWLAFRGIVWHATFKGLGG